MNEKTMASKLNKDLKAKGLSSSLKESTEILETVIDFMSNEITSGRELKFRNFGTFSSKLRSFKNHFSEEKEVIQKFKISFLASKFMNTKLNNNAIKK